MALSKSWADLNSDELTSPPVAVASQALRLDEAVKYSQQRETFGQPIANHCAIQLKLADMVTKAGEAARLLTYRAAEAYDRGERCDMEAGMAKLLRRKRPSTTRWTPCAFMAAMDIRKNFRSNASIVTPRC